MMAAGSIEVAPLAYMRGRTLNDSFIILDEAQNTSAEQMKMFLTRLGFGSRMVVTGDITQVDLPTGQPSGLRLVQDILEGLDDVHFSRLTSNDVVRHRLVGDIVNAYERYDARIRGTALPPERLPAARRGGAAIQPRAPAGGAGGRAQSPVRSPAGSAVWCCAPRWPASRRAAPRTPCGTNLSCCAPMASCTCSDMITPNPMNVPPCSACKMSCSAHGARSAGPPATGRGRKGPGDASMAWLVVAAIVATLPAGGWANAEVALVRASRAGAQALAPGEDDDASSRLQARRAGPSRYLSVLLLAGVSCATSATVLMAAALLRWLGPGGDTCLRNAWM